MPHYPTLDERASDRGTFSAVKIRNKTGTARSIPLPSRVPVSQTRSIRSERGGTVGTTSATVYVPQHIDVSPYGTVDVPDATASDSRVRRMVAAGVLAIEGGAR
jgi:hypothetical protein